MSKLNQTIVLFIEPAGRKWHQPSKIGNLFINRFSIDEDAKNEILKIYQLEYPFFNSLIGELTLEEGLDLINHRIAYDSLGRTNFVRSVKETRFLDIIDAGVASMVDFGKNDMMPHFVYCFEDYIFFEEKLKQIILKKVQKYGISSSIVTMLTMSRINLITKEKSKAAAE